MLVKILTYHVVPGRLSASDLRNEIKAGNGEATLKTVSGGTLIATMQGGHIVLKDEKGDMSTVTISNVNQSNGVIPRSGHGSAAQLARRILPSLAMALRKIGAPFFGAFGHEWRVEKTERPVCDE